jgi:hypothetical protein
MSDPRAGECEPTSGGGALSAELQLRLSGQVATAFRSLARQYEITTDNLIAALGTRSLGDGSAIAAAQLARQLRAADELANEAQEMGLY